MNRVLLVLPPLVESNFGQIYPSTAVLAAYLADQGVDSTQIDLNDRFLDHLLSEAELERAASGAFERSREIHRAAAAWALRRRRAGTLDVDELRRAAGDASDPDLVTVLRRLASPYLVDPGRAALTSGEADPAVRASYERFFLDHLVEFERAADHTMLVGLSAPMGPQLLPTLWLASALRNRLGPEGPRLVVGGPALSLLTDEDLDRLLVNHPEVDAIVRYDGEVPLLALADQCSVGEWDPGRVPGVSCLVDGRVRHVAPSPGPKLDQLATPHYPPALLESSGATTLGVYQARGCYWGKCDYCDFVEVYKGSRSYRGRSPELVLNDIATLVERTGIRRYRLITEAIPSAFARRFSELVAASGLDISWSSFAMVDRRFDRDLLQLMADAGCDGLVIGLESMVTRVLRVVHKSADREQNVRFIRDAHAAGIRLKVNLIPDLPTTTVDEALQGLADLEELAECFQGVSVFGFEPTHSSNVGRSPERFGFVPIESLRKGTHSQFAANTMQVVDPSMSDEERAVVMDHYRAFAQRVNGRHASRAAGSERSFRSVVPGAATLTILDLLTGERQQLAGSQRRAG